MSRKQNDDEHYAELAMKILGYKETWRMRAWVLAAMLKRHGIDADFVLRADKAELVRLLEGEEKPT